MVSVPILINADYRRQCHSVSVPIFSWSRQKGLVVEDVVSMLDLVPTVLGLTGADQTEDEFIGEWWLERHGPLAPLPGEDLTDVLLDGGRPKRRNALVEYDSDTQSVFDLLQMRALVTNEYKLVYYAPRNEIMLFDRENAPDEMNNLAGGPEYKTVILDLLKQLLCEISRTESRRPRQICGA